MCREGRHVGVNMHMYNVHVHVHNVCEVSAGPQNTHVRVYLQFWTLNVRMPE